MNTKELGERISRTKIPNLDDYTAFIFWSLFVTGEDPRYAKSERLEELWARWNIEAPDAVRAIVEKFERDRTSKDEYMKQMQMQQMAQAQQIFGQKSLQPQHAYPFGAQQAYAAGSPQKTWADMVREYLKEEWQK